MIEVWKDVPEYEGHYMVSNIGRVRSIKPGKEKIMKTATGDQYPRNAFCKDGVQKNLRIHTLVAKAFIPNPENFPTVNHIDGDKNNNNVSNLEWASYGQNNLHACNVGLRPIVKPIIAFVPGHAGGYCYPSISHAVRCGDGTFGSISRAIRKTHPLHRGMYWESVNRTSPMNQPQQEQAA